MKLLNLIAIALFAISSASYAGTAAANMVLTPVGYRDASSLHHVGAGQTLSRLGNRMQIVDTKTRRVLSSSAASNGALKLHDSGWIGSTLWKITGDSVNTFTTTWVVPPEPQTQSNQTVFLFNGIMNSARDTILQPVLQWGEGADGGGAYWSIASWFVGAEGTYYTTPIQVNPGSTLTGVMTLTGSSGGKFSYTSEFQEVSGTSLPVENVSELIWLSETLEAYGINQCTEYPLGDTAFTNIGLTTTNNSAILNWGVTNYVTDCGQHTQVVSNSPTNGEVDIYYNQ